MYTKISKNISSFLLQFLLIVQFINTIHHLLEHFRQYIDHIRRKCAGSFISERTAIEKHLGKRQSDLKALALDTPHLSLKSVLSLQL